MDLVRLFEIVKMAIVILGILACFALIPFIVDEFSEKVVIPSEKKQRKRKR